MKKILLFGLITFLLDDCSCYVSYQPEQVHLALGENVSEIVVTWSTRDDTVNSIVEYGINGMILTAKGASQKFVDGGAEKSSQYIHRVKLPNLTPSSKYGQYSHNQLK